MEALKSELEACVRVNLAMKLEREALMCSANSAMTSGPEAQICVKTRSCQRRQSSLEKSRSNKQPSPDLSGHAVALRAAAGLAGRGIEQLMVCGRRRENGTSTHEGTGHIYVFSSTSERQPVRGYGCAQSFLAARPVYVWSM